MHHFCVLRKSGNTEIELCNSCYCKYADLIYESFIMPLVDFDGCVTGFKPEGDDIDVKI